jgi:quinolinate synthase
LKKVKEENPNALLIAHPECKEVILSQADFVGSTTALLNFVKDSDCQEFIVATEAGILHKMKESVPNKRLFQPLPTRKTLAHAQNAHI